MDASTADPYYRAVEMYVGIDLAAQPANTAVCVLAPTRSQLQIAALHQNVGDTELLELLTSSAVRRAGIDAPFGWPSDFIDAIRRYDEAGVWPDAPGTDDAQRLMRLRHTDRAVIAACGVTPLSVSTDRIAVVAMRCARLLAAFWEQSGTSADRTGKGKVLEVYPAAAMRLWGISQHNHPQDPGSYKGNSAGAIRRRERVVRAIRHAGSGWLELPPEHADACADSDHLLDALLSSLVALAADGGTVESAPDEIPPGEGWIALPTSPLSEVGGQSSPRETTPVEPAQIIPRCGYLELNLPDVFRLEIQDRVGGPWGLWATGLERTWFERLDDGSYACTDTGHGGSPIYFRAISIDADGVFEHVDQDGFGHVYRYRLRAESSR